MFRIEGVDATFSLGRGHVRSCGWIGGMRLALWI